MLSPDTIDLKSLPWLPLNEKSAFPKQAAIYFAIDSQGCVQYIGRSVNVRARWGSHHKYESLSAIGNIRIAYLFVDMPELLPQIETALIEYFQPILNIRGLEINQTEGKSARGKRKDPNYGQLVGDVKKDTGLKFKAACTLNELTLGEGLEQAILLWLEQDELKKSPSQAKAEGGAV